MMVLTCRPLGRFANDTVRILVFMLTDRYRDSADIEVVRLQMAAFLRSDLVRRRFD